MVCLEAAHLANGDLSAPIQQTVDGAPIQHPTLLLATGRPSDLTMLLATGAAGQAFLSAAAAATNAGDSTPQRAVALIANALPPTGWLVEVEASLPEFDAVPLEPTTCRMTALIGRGGAADVVLTLNRAVREVIVRIASSEAFASIQNPWASSRSRCRICRLRSITLARPLMVSADTLVWYGDAISHTPDAEVASSADSLHTQSSLPQPASGPLSLVTVC